MPYKKTTLALSGIGLRKRDEIRIYDLAVIRHYAIHKVIWTELICARVVLYGICADVSHGRPARWLVTDALVEAIKVEAR